MAHLAPFSYYKELHDAKGRRTHAAFLVEGFRALSLIAQTSPQSIAEILVCEDDAAALPLEKLRGMAELRMLGKKQLNAVATSTTPMGVLAVIRLPQQAYAATLPDSLPDRVIVCEDVQDPGNVGTLIRTAAAFGFGGIVLSDKCADPFSPKAVQASAGTILSLWVRRTPAYLACLASLAVCGHVRIAADVRGSQELSRVQVPPKLALMLGNEGNGLSDAALACADLRVRVPMDTALAESLNVACTGAICMYALMHPPTKHAG